jgi:signal transduction histidine kinase
MTIQTKTTVLFTVLTAAVFLVLTATVYYFSNKFAFNDFYKRLELRARIAAKFSFEKDHISTEAFKQLQQEYLERLPNEKSYTVKLGTNGKPEPPVPSFLPAAYLKSIAKAGGATIYHRDKFVHYAGLLYRDETGNFLVIESALNTYGNQIIVRLRNILIITFVASVVLIYTAGLYFSRKTFAPFSEMTNQVVAISEGNLHLRLKQQEGTDEIAGLINTFNSMLDRLETAFETQNNFVSNASHELRTPLTAIVAEADYTLSQNRSPDHYRQSLQNIVQQAAKLQDLTRGLLSLAQTNFDGRKQSWGKQRLDELLYNVKENTTTIFSNQVLVNLPGMPDNEDDICVTGNYDLLKIALGNIVLNACKYSGHDPITLTLELDEKHAVISISDTGIGIPAAEIRHVFDPFFRASNAQGFEGYGIGMPLSGNIIRMHRGKIAVASAVNQGTTVKVTLPLAR